MKRKNKKKRTSNVKLFINNTWLLLKSDPIDKIVFSALCGVFSYFIFLLMKSLCETAMTKTMNISYIDKSNIIKVLTSVPTLIIVLCFMLVMTHCALFEIGGFLHAFSMAQIGRRTNLWNMIMVGYETLKKTLYWKNWPVYLFVLLLFPLTGILSLSNIPYKIKIPSFVELGIVASPNLIRAFLAFYFCMLVVELCIFFAINIYVLQKKNFVQSCKEAFKLGRGHYGNTLICMLGGSFCVNIINYIIVLVLCRDSQSDAAYALGYLLNMLIMPIINNAGITALFYLYFEEENSLAKITPHMFTDKKLSVNEKTLIVNACILMTLIGAVFMWHDYGDLLDDVGRPLVCAHRGDNYNRVDNSYEAFELAAAEQLPWIELDVQITADDVVIAEHDGNLQRHFGISKAVADLTYDEICQLKFIHVPEGTQARITTLEEVLLLAKENDMMVQIETKPSDKKGGLEEEVLKIVEDTGMHDKIMIISLHSDSIAKMKELDPTITTAHATMMVWKEYTDVTDADNLSTEIGSVTPTLVKTLHEAGKKVFCWTADDPDDIQYLVSCGVDVIGTDDPLMVLEELDKADYSGGLKRIYYILMQNIADMAR